MCNSLAGQTFDRWSGWYDRLLWPLDRLFLNRWRKRLWSGIPAGRILEVGVGSGASFPWYPAGAVITGIDVSQGMLAVAARRADDHRTAVDLKQMDVQRLDFPDAYFDAVVGSLVFCSVPNPGQGLRELRRVCKPRGELRLLEHVRSEGWLGPIMDRLSEPLERRYGEYINRRTAHTVSESGWRLEYAHNVLLDIVQLIRATPDHGAC